MAAAHAPAAMSAAARPRGAASSRSRAGCGGGGGRQGRRAGPPGQQWRGNRRPPHSRQPRPCPRRPIQRHWRRERRLRPPHPRLGCVGARQVAGRPRTVGRLLPAARTGVEAHRPLCRGQKCIFWERPHAAAADPTAALDATVATGATATVATATSVTVIVAVPVAAATRVTGCTRVIECRQSCPRRQRGHHGRPVEGVPRHAAAASTPPLLPYHHIPGAPLAAAGAVSPPMDKPKPCSCEIRTCGA